jgi:signal transduction histidine kinase
MHYYDVVVYPLVADGITGAVVRLDDVTQRVHMEEMLVQSEKMLSLGGLAAGMAHEINNPLGIISQAVQNIERRLSVGLPANLKTAQDLGLDFGAWQAYLAKREIPQFVLDIRTAVSRATRIVSGMLQFSRKSSASRQAFPLAEVLEKALELAANDYDLKKRYDFRSIQIVREYDPSLPAVPLVLVEMEQVFLNLLKNAAQAMTTNPPDRKPMMVLRLRRENRYAVAEVEDNGPGMEEKVRRRVFEPFFTTKGPGMGTGLGLSVSFMIVTQNHKGLISVDSVPGQGSRFTVGLPFDESISQPS